MREPLWLSLARMTEGISEIPGPLSNPIILRWAKEINAPAYVNDDTAWCAVWMNRVLQAAQLPLAGIGYDLLRAMTFKTYGMSMPSAALGAIMVFMRPTGGHVGFYLGERADAYYVLGGNTTNSVSAAWLAKTRLVAMRWPFDVPLPASTVPILLADNGAPLSTNEA